MDYRITRRGFAAGAGAMALGAAGIGQGARAAADNQT